MVASLSLFLVGIVGGVVTYLVGTPLNRVIDNSLVLEISIASVPLVIGFVGNLMVIKGAKLEVSSVATFLAQPIGFLAVPAYFTLAGNDYQVLGGLATVIVSIPALVIVPVLTRWVLRNR